MQKVIYLTIDDSPSPDFAEKVRFLRAHAVPAVFFCRGDLLAQQVPLAVWALRQGMVLANHSFTHPHFSDVPVADGQADIRRADELLQRVHDQAGLPWTRKYFRFPYGDQGDLKRGRLLQPYAAIPQLADRRRTRWLQQALAAAWPARYAALVRRLAATGAARKRQLQHCLAELGYTRPSLTPPVRYGYWHQYEGLDWPWTFDALEWATTQPQPLGGIGTLAQVLARLDLPNPPDLRGPVPGPAYGPAVPGSAEVLLLHDHAATSAMFYQVVRHLLARGVVFGALP